jgi:hypothetical protein
LTRKRSEVQILYRPQAKPLVSVTLLVGGCCVVTLT